MMTDEQVREYLENNGYPPRVVRGGKAGLLADWQRFVEEVERGYRFHLEDYRNDLDTRSILELIGADGPELDEADRRFRALQQAHDVRVWESGAGDPWWDFGYPRNIGEKMRADLTAEGLL